MIQRGLDWAGHCPYCGRDSEVGSGLQIADRAGVPVCHDCAVRIDPEICTVPAAYEMLYEIARLPRGNADFRQEQLDAIFEMYLHALWCSGRQDR